MAARSSHQPTLDHDLPPRIGIDPGAARTAIVVAVGTVALPARVVHNPEPSVRIAGHTAYGCSPEYRYAETVWDYVDNAMRWDVWRDLAVQWWADHGVTIADGDSPWIVGVEKVNLPHEGGAEGYTVGVGEALSLVAAAHVHGVVWGRIPAENRVSVIPFRADTRWERRFGGNGRLTDWYPEDYIREALDSRRFADGVYPDRHLDRPDFRGTGVKDRAAAWSIAGDAALAWTKASRSLTHSLTIAAPHDPVAVAHALAEDARRSLAARNARRASA